MAKRLASRTQIQRAAALAVALVAASGLAVCAGTVAGAEPAPTISQVQSEIDSLQARSDKVGEQYDAATQQLTAARARLAQVTKEAARAQARYSKARTQLIAVAVAAYENSDRTSILGLLSSGDPSTVLGQASIVMAVAGTHNLEASQFLTAARQLSTIRDQRKHTEEGIAQIQSRLAGKKASLAKLLDSRKTLLANLTAQQQAQVIANSVGAAAGSGSGSGSGCTRVSYTGPTTTQAEKAIAFAYAQICKPYVWGATGPNSYDCSGLVQAAWAAAGVSIPRTTYEQWAALPHIPLSSIQPGDLLLYNGEGHVAMYVGNGYIIDAPRTGLDVERIAYNTSWYVANLDGAVRP